MIAAAREVEAEFVFAFTALVIPEVSLSVFALISETIEDDADRRVERDAREQESRLASVKRRVAAPQTPVAVSDTSVPKEVRVRLPELQTLAGIAVMLESI